MTHKDFLKLTDMNADLSFMLNKIKNFTDIGVADEGAIQSIIYDLADAIDEINEILDRHADEKNF